MQLIDLPMDVLVLLPAHLHNIEDYTNASSTCRSLRSALSHTAPSTILRLAAASSRVFFRPDPHFLIAATARQVAVWALGSPINTEKLRVAFTGGVNTLLQLCIEVAGLTMSEIRRLYELRFSTINPVTDLIDRLAGKQWYSVPNFWNGGASDAVTIYCEPERATYQIAIYGDLFSSSFDALLHPELELPYFGLEMRMEYIRYCIPDMLCLHGNPGMPPANRTGPYLIPDPDIREDQCALQHLLNCRRWREARAVVRRKIGPDFESAWKQRIWDEAVQTQGLDGLAMMRPGGVEAWRERLGVIRTDIERLEVCPKTYGFGPYENPASEWPSLKDEVFVLMAGRWQTR